jgi:hypothetical protein
MELHFKDPGESDFRLYKAMQKWYLDVGDILAYVNDVLHPHGFEESERRSPRLAPDVTAPSLMPKFQGYLYRSGLNNHRKRYA